MVVAIMAAAAYYYIFVYSVNHHRNVENETSIDISAEALVNAYEQNEANANQLYLNKGISTKGAVINIGKDQANNNTLTIGSETAMSNVFVTLKTNQALPHLGDTIIIKGICNGYLSDVVISDAIIIH